MPLFAALAPAGLLIAREAVVFRTENKRTGREAQKNYAGPIGVGKAEAPGPGGKLVKVSVVALNSAAAPRPELL